ncbi:hypothetical protein GCM10010441_72300 [Kitasatospora paracochleata]
MFQSRPARRVHFTAVVRLMPRSELRTDGGRSAARVIRAELRREMTGGPWRRSFEVRWWAVTGWLGKSHGMLGRADPWTGRMPP